MILYFSGTGNSAYCAKWLGERLQDEVVNIGLCMKEGKPKAFTSKTPWVFVAPIYACRIPDVVTAWLRSFQFAGSLKAYFIVTSGGDMGGAGLHLEALCKEIGFVYQGTLEVVMPSNYCAMFPVPDREKAKEIIKAATPSLETALKRIQERDTLPPVLPKKGDKLKAGLVCDLFYKLCVKDKKYWTNDLCNGCGKCVKLCPLNNITLQEGLPVWHGHCTHCMGCIGGCPTAAIEYGKKTVGKPRYYFPGE